MKFVITTAMLLLCLCSTHAGEKEELAKKLYTAMKSEKMVDQVFESMAPALNQMIGVQDPDITEEEKKERSILLEEIFVITKETFPMDAIRKMTQDIYIEVFSEEELRGLLAFYESPLGQVWAEKQGLVIKASGEKMGPVMVAWYPEFQEKIEAHIKRHNESKGN